MAQQTIDIGAAPNDGNGDPLRTAFTKINENFTENYQAIDDLGSGPFQSVITNGVFESSSGLEITVTGAGGIILFGQTLAVIDNNTATLPDNDTSYVEFEYDAGSANLVSNTNEFTEGNYPVGIAVTQDGELLLPFSDKRPFASVPNNLTHIFTDDSNPITVNENYYGTTLVAEDANMIFSLSAGLTIGSEIAFVLNNAGQVTIALNGAETIRIGTAVSTAGGNITATDLGATIRIKKITATGWFSIAREGTWTVSV